MSAQYKNETERYAYFMVIEGAALLLVVGLLTFDARVQQFLFGSRSASANVAQQVDLRKIDNGVTVLKRQQSSLTIEATLENSSDDGLQVVESGASGLGTIGSGARENFLKETREKDFLELSSNNPELIGQAVNDSQPLELSEYGRDDADSASNDSDLKLAESGSVASPTQLPQDLADLETAPDSSIDEIPGMIVDDTHSKNSDILETNNHALDDSLQKTLSPGEFGDVVLDAAEAVPPVSGQNIRSADLALLDVENPTWWMDQYDQQQLPGRIPLRASLDEVVFVALRNSPQLNILNTEPAIQETVINEEVAAFDWGTFAETRWFEQDEPIGSDLTTGAPGRFIQRTWSYEAGLTKQLARGGDVRFGQNFGTLDNNSSFLNPPDQGTSQFIIDYRQPLLRGFGRTVTTSQIVLADIAFDAVSSRAIQDTQRFIVDVVSAYWDVYFARVSLIQNRRNVQRAEELLRQLRQRQGIDVANDQLLRAEAAAAARRSDLIRAVYDLVNSQDILNNLTIGPESIRAEGIELIPDAVNLPSVIQLSEAQLLEVAITNRPEIREAFVNTKAAALRQAVAANSLLPRLDAIVQTYVNGLQDNKDFTSAFVDQFSAGNPSYSVGLSYDLPIGNRAARARLKRTELQAKLIQTEFQKTMGDVVLDTRITSRNVLRLNEEIQNNYQALLKARQELWLIRRRQQMQLDDNRTGSLYIEDLLASQARLTAAEQRLADTQRQQAVALVDLKRSTGELLHSGGLDHCSRPVAVPLEKLSAFAQAVPENLPKIRQALNEAPANENDFQRVYQGVKQNLNDF